MKARLVWLLIMAGWAWTLPASAQDEPLASVTVPVVMDHNRMLVDAEFQGKEGQWRKARLWVDTGNPDFFVGETLARDLGIDLSKAAAKPAEGPVPPLEAPPPRGVRIGGMTLDFAGVNSYVMFCS